MGFLYLAYKMQRDIRNGKGVSLVLGWDILGILAKIPGLRHAKQGIEKQRPTDMPACALLLVLT
jgi:hypothetical protein